MSKKYYIGFLGIFLLGKRALILRKIEIQLRNFNSGKQRTA